jgi:hypothetical protein
MFVAAGPVEQSRTTGRELCPARTEIFFGNGSHERSGDQLEKHCRHILSSRATGSRLRTSMSARISAGPWPSDVTSAQSVLELYRKTGGARCFQAGRGPGRGIDNAGRSSPCRIAFLPSRPGGEYRVAQSCARSMLNIPQKLRRSHKTPFEPRLPATVGVPP